MEIVLRVAITIVGTVIGSLIGVHISQFFIDRQDRKDQQRFARKTAPIMQPNIDFIAEMNSESNILFDMQNLREGAGTRKILSNEFFQFCAQHSCSEACKTQNDYCPIADEARKQYGAIHGGEECQSVFVQFKESKK